MRANDIAVTICASALKDSVPKEGTLEERLLWAMREVRKPNGPAFMCSSDDEQFRGAVGGILLTCSDDERERIEADLQNLKILSAMLSGIPVDLEQVKLPENPLGLTKLWREAAEVRGAAAPSPSLDASNPE